MTQDAEQKGAGEERRHELPNRDAGSARHDQFVFSVEADQNRHAHEEGNEGNGLLHNERQAHGTSSRRPPVTVIAGKTGEAASRLAEIHEVTMPITPRKNHIVVSR